MRNFLDKIWPKRREVDSPTDDEDETLDLNDPFPTPTPVPITDVFDLHTIAPRDVRRAVAAYLIEARRAKFRAVRLIHGKGIGVQRRAVREVLAQTSFVSEWYDAPPQAGGMGATIAHLRRAEDDGKKR